jgi:hypothetical protein
MGLMRRPGSSEGTERRQRMAVTGAAYNRAEARGRMIMHGSFFA